MFPDYYKILSLSPDADADQIKKAFKEKALLYHPDVNNDEKAVEVFQLINLAYQTLIDPELRRKYDFKLKYGQLIDSEPVDIRRRHPADADYYRRRAQQQTYSRPRKTSRNIQLLNYFIFYSITIALGIGIIFGIIDLFVNFRIGGLLFSIISLVLIISGVRVIKKEKADKNK